MNQLSRPAKSLFLQRKTNPPPPPPPPPPKVCFLWTNKHWLVSCPPPPPSPQTLTTFREMGTYSKSHLPPSSPLESAYRFCVHFVLRKPEKWRLILNSTPPLESVCRFCVHFVLRQPEKTYSSKTREVETCSKFQPPTESDFRFCSTTREVETYSKPPLPRI